MTLAARMGYIFGTVLLGVMVGRFFSGNRSGTNSRLADPPVEELAEKLGQAWGPYHNR